MTLITILVKASILICAAALIHALCGRRMSAATRHLMWTFVIGGLLVLPALSFVLPSWTAFTTTAVVPHEPAQAVRQEPARLLEEGPEREATLNTTNSPPSTPALRTTIPWPSKFMILYAAGTVFF